MDDVWIITPISWTLVLTVILFPVLLFFVGVDAVLGFICSNINTINLIIGIISVIIMVIPFFSGFHLGSILAVIAGPLPISQLLYMLHNGILSIQKMPTAYLWTFWRLIVFVIWFIYVLINVLVSLGSLVLGFLGAFSYKEIRSTTADTGELWGSLGLAAGLSTAVGVIGWVINSIFL